MSSFSLGDFVTIERPNEEKPLIGTVAYVGPVHFAEGDDWVGIKLSGSSIGLGKNDGSVKGKRYFEDCGERGGAFVRKSVLKKRTPSKLEELRLRKEKRESSRRLSTSTPSSSATTATTTTRASRRSLDGKIGGSPSSSANVSVSSNSVDKKSVPSKATLTSPRIVDTNTAKTRSSKASVSPPKPSVTNNNSEISQAQELKLQAAKAESNKAKEKITMLEKENQNLTKQKDTLSDKYQSLEQNHSSLMEKYEALQSKYISSQNSKEDSADSGSGEIIEELNGQLRSKESELEKYKSENQELNEQIAMKETNLQNQIDSLEAQLLQSNTKVSQLTQELSTMNAQSASRGQSEQSYLKEKTKFQSENISLKRRVKELEESTIDLEAAIEDLTLDKEQLAEEKEQMEDTLQEKLLDIEGANLELEDVKLQLEEAHVQIEEMKLSFSQNDGDEANAVGEANSDNAEEMVQTLSTQNGRLREALVRLREQSNIEKMELAKQVRTLEKESSALKETSMKAENLSVKTKEYEEQIRELKEMVDENSVMESLMEELSDKNLVLEDANIKLKGNIASLEEAAEIAAEMEELQQEEISTLMQNLEEKESQVLALETAIQLQRKREDDFQKTFQKYKISNERLQQESLMLREKHEDGAGEKSQLLATSQKALAQASIMVQNAANMRKELAKAVFDQIDFRVNKIFSERIQSFLPTQEFVGTEISALRGELLLVKVSSLASISLKDVTALNLKSMQKAREELSSKPEMLDESKEDSEEIITISDDAAQEISVIIHQAKFAFLANEAGAETLRILCMGQWPNLLNPEKSSELAASIVGPFASLNEALSNNLRIMKEEGTLSPHHANFSNLEDSMKEVKSLDSKEWEPPAWSIFRDVTSAKYACLGAAAIVSCIISPISETGNDAFISPYTPSSPLGLLFAELEQVVSEASKITQRLTAPSQQDTPTPVLEATIKWCESSHKLLNLFENVFRDMEVMEDKIYECHAQVSQVLDDAVKVSALVRAHKMLGEEDGGYHPFSPESDSCWEAVVEIVSDMVSEENSDETEKEKFVNFVLRSQAVEQRLTNALENETKLLVATEQVSSLEKTLASRTTQINMQNARMTELEKLLSQQHTSTPQITSSTSAPENSNDNIDNVVNSKEEEKTDISSKEVDSLRKENSMLMEAMDVLNTQVQEIEKENRALKKDNNKMSKLSRKSMGADAELFSKPSGKAISLEAALFRPALKNALGEAASWRSILVKNSLSQLKPLNAPKKRHQSVLVQGQPQPQEGDSIVVEQTHTQDQLSICLEEFYNASTTSRLEKASSKVIDFSDFSKKNISRKNTIRNKFRDTQNKKMITTRRVEKAISAVHDTGIKFGPSKGISESSSFFHEKRPIGRMTFSSSTSEKNKVVPVFVEGSELRQLYTRLLQ